MANAVKTAPNTKYFILSPPVNDTNYTRSSTYFLTESQKNNNKFDSTASNIDSSDGWYVQNNDDYPDFNQPTSIQMEYLLQLMYNMWCKSEDNFDFGRRSDELMTLFAETNIQYLKGLTTWELLKKTE